MWEWGGVVAEEVVVSDRTMVREGADDGGDSFRRRSWGVVDDARLHILFDSTTINSQLSTLNSQANQPDRSFHPLSCLLGRFIYQFQKKNYLFIHFPFVFFFFFFVFVILKSFISINFLTLTIVRGIFGTTSQVSPRPIGFIQQQNNGRITRTKKK